MLTWQGAQQPEHGLGLKLQTLKLGGGGWLQEDVRRERQQQVTLQHLQNAGLEQHLSEVEAIAKLAVEEQALEQGLARMQATWSCSHVPLDDAQQGTVRLGDISSIQV